jgi:hypothetical protein
MILPVLIINSKARADKEKVIIGELSSRKVNFIQLFTRNGDFYVN